MTADRPPIEAVDLEWAAGRLTPPRARPRGVARAVARFEARLADLVFSDATLEGNPFTLPEVRTLLDGLGVDGHTLLETRQVLSLAASSRFVADTARRGPSLPSRDTSDTVNRLVTEHEVIEPGVLRGTGTVTGGGAVNAMGHRFQAPQDPVRLASCFDEGARRAAGPGHPVANAAMWAAWATYYQFYFDGNKRTSRHTMNLALMSQGFDAIMVREADRRAYNQALADLFATGDPTPYAQLLVNRYEDS
ncbi:MAG: hypothetical protein LBS56_02660 [Propionibacteriaceae bacterium]|jgi:Fic family protein|nr:hypothetical protein [Propionibacteriaceae bacterium]